jgi:hypothetical protein
MFLIVYLRGLYLYVPLFLNLVQNFECDTVNSYNK